MSAPALPLEAPRNAPAQRDTSCEPPADAEGQACPSAQGTGRAGRRHSPGKRGDAGPMGAAARATRVGGALQAAAALVWLPQAAALAYGIDVIARGGALEDGPMAQVALAAAAVLGLGVARALLDAFGARLVFRAARRALTDLRAEVGAALARRSPLDRERPAAGLAASAMAEQAEAVLPYLTRFVPARQRLSIVPLAILCVVTPLSWTAALVLLVAAPLIPLFMALVGIRAKAASEAQMVELGTMNAFLLDRLRGLSTIRTLGAVDLTARRLRANAEALKARTLAVLRIAFLSSAVLELFSALGVAMVAVYVGFHLLGQLGFGAWGAKLSLGEGLFILLLAPAFFEPLRDFSAAWHDRAAGEAAFEALDALARAGTPLPGAETSPEAPALEAPAVEAPAPAGALAVEVSGLSFRHAGASASVFSDLHMSIAAGERVALLGPSGQGKSTLLALIAGLAPAAAGSIAIGGEPLTAASAARLRARMAFLDQKPHIFAGILSANITLARPALGPEDVARAVRLAALERVMATHRGPVGEGGEGLSGGETRRLALARAAADPAAGLILADEPTAHLDAETAAQVTDGLLALAEGRTLIVATHDSALAARMDRVIRLEALP